MRIFACKICSDRKKTFTGDRKMVRKHIRKEHLIKGKVKDAKGNYAPSPITREMIKIEWAS